MQADQKVLINLYHSVLGDLKSCGMAQFLSQFSLKMPVHLAKKIIQYFTS
jgi:hypothetical protein